jgi:hypothetical protein
VSLGGLGQCTNPNPKPWGNRNPARLDVDNNDLKEAIAQLFLTKAGQRIRNLNSIMASLNANDIEVLEWIVGDLEMALGCLSKPELRGVGQLDR